MFCDGCAYYNDNYCHLMLVLNPENQGEKDDICVYYKGTEDDVARMIRDNTYKIEIQFEDLKTVLCGNKLVGRTIVTNLNGDDILYYEFS